MEKLGIQSTLLITQIINFGIILYILNRFAYKPVLAMIDKRKKEIEDGIQLKAELEEKMELLETQQKKRKEEDLQEAKRRIKLLLDDAKKQGRAIVEDEKRKMKDEREQVLVEIAQERGKMIEDTRKKSLTYAVLISEKLLGRQLDSASQRRLLKEVIAEIEQS